MPATILCYHKVGPFAEEGRRLNIEPERLRQHVGFFVRRRHAILRAADFSATWPENAVGFTFDDAYESALKFAPPILESLGVRGTFYAVPGKVGASSDWDGPAARPLAGIEALRAAQAAGHEIGNHTWGHVHLDQVSAMDQLEQIKSADFWLREHGFSPGSFCYPYGSYDASARAAAASLYPVAVILAKRRVSAGADRHALPRIPVAFSDSLPLLLYRIYVRARVRRER